jgi:YbbR domain-containing protein
MIKWDAGIWLRKFLKKGGSSIDRDVFIFSFFLLLSFIFWYLNSLGKETEYNIKYPVKYINFPQERVLAEDLPSTLDLSLKGPGYSVLKLKLSGNRAPVILDISSISYRRVPGSRSLNYYIVTSGLIPKLKNQLRADCTITSIRPDTLFLYFDKIITKQVGVIPSIEVTTEKQYLIKGNIMVNPDTVTITGPKQIIDTIRSIKTKYKKLKGVDETVTLNLPLVTLKEYSVSEKRVMVTVPVEQFTEAEYHVRVKILNNPDSVDVKIFPDAVTVKCLVAVSDYKKIGELPFEVILDLEKANLNSSEKLPLSFRNIPPFISSLRVVPSEVDFLIEKKLR